MTAYFAYVEDRFKRLFRDPIGAFKTLQDWKTTEFTPYWTDDLITVFPGNAVGALDLTGNGRGGLAMSGTTAELQASLTAIGVGPVAGIATTDSRLCVNYVRVKTPTMLHTETVVSIGTIHDWWGTAQFDDAGADRGWRNLFFHNIEIGLQKQTFTGLVAKVALVQGKGAWIHW
jgi:hypothetical protein